MNYPKNIQAQSQHTKIKPIFAITETLRIMKTLLIFLSLLLVPAVASAQSELPKDSIHGIPTGNYKEFSGGFLLDMGMKIIAPPPLVPPQLYYNYPLTDKAKDYSHLFKLSPEIIYGRMNGSSYSSGTYPITGRYGFGTMPTLQSATFKLKNGLHISTYGEYDADGYKVRNPSALPWEKNNFNGAFEFKSANGKFGIRLEVQQGRSLPPI